MLLKRFFYIWCHWLIKPFLIFVKPQVFPENPEALQASLDGKPVCYVLKQHSWIDRAVVRKVCKQLGLVPMSARWGDFPTEETAACLYLHSLQRELETGEGDLVGQFELVTADSDYPLQLVPVSIFWGRSPGSETSLFKLLLGDADRAGRFRKLVIMLVQGRRLMVNFAEPVDSQEILQRSDDSLQAARTLARVLALHMQRQKTATLGPSLLGRPLIIRAILNRKGVRRAIVAAAADQKLDEDKVRALARKMAEEIAANFDVRAIRFLELVCRWIFRKVFAGLDIQHIERFREQAKDYQVIYMPSHRSHFDYLLISYTLFVEGLVPPHIAAGNNLNFWPVGGLLRRAGAFYLRRKFAGDKLYTAVFKGYLEVLMARGYPIEFFPEGGRSRTGRLLPPKTGMLAMLIEAYAQRATRPTALVPVYVGYDKLVESNSYLKELSGGKKRNESAGQLLKATKIFESSYGSPHVAFGSAVPLDAALNELQPDWRERVKARDLAWVTEVAGPLARHCMERINAAVIINPIGLVAMIMLSSPRQAIARSQLLEQIDVFMQLLRTVPYSDEMTLPTGTTEEIFEQAARTAGLQSIEHPWGELITIEGKEAILLSYYRNAVMHALALPSLIARFFRHSQRLKRSELVARCCKLYPFLKRELFIHFSREECAAQVERIVDAYLAMGLLRQAEDSGMLYRPALGTPQYAGLIGLSRILRDTLERYTMTFLLLAHEVGSEGATRQKIEDHVVHMAQRLAILNGNQAPEYHDKNLFRQSIEQMLDEGFLTSEDSDDEQRLFVNPKLQPLSQEWVSLLGLDVQQSMQQLISDPAVSLSPA